VVGESVAGKDIRAWLKPQRADLTAPQAAHHSAGTPISAPNRASSWSFPCVPQFSFDIVGSLR
jgi:hypothetical protein